jgi:uncharacterized protein (DUF2062 family)
VKALSISCGLLVGVTPLYGLHTIIILFLASVFRLNKVISFLFTRISIPPIFPFIVATALYLGSPFVEKPTENKNMQFSFLFFKEHLVQYLIGTSLLGVGLAVIGGGISYYFLERKTRKLATIVNSNRRN